MADGSRDDRPRSKIMTKFLLMILTAAMSWGADLTGNWLAAAPRGDGTSRKTWLNLKQQGDRITGTIRSTQFIYTIAESAGGPEHFTLTAVANLEGRDYRATYDVTLAGDVLNVVQVRNNTPGTPVAAHRVPEGDGALPPRVALPALHKVPDNGLARTPPMGWNSWNKFSTRVSDEIVRGVADSIASNGMREAGYIYITIDDTWEGERDAQGVLHSNTKFPDMKALADYVHSKGLKLGLYSGPGLTTCQGYDASHGHEDVDARTWAAWGIDYLKYDWCGARMMYTEAEEQALYQRMGDALAASGRKIVFSLCQYGRADVWKWGPDVGGNLWRTTGDISDRWDSMERIGFNQDALAPYAAPGHWNDPDMLEIGNGGMTDVEYRTHMSLWSMLAAPLIAGNDVRKMSQSVKDILLNREVIAIDQDKLGKQAKRAWQSGEQEIWTRPLGGGDTAVAIFNRGKDSAPVTVKWGDIGFSKSPTRARDLWLHEDVTFTGWSYMTDVPSHGVVLLRVRK
jgi:alpha-galactosidase